jgi:hypothetical protein
MNTFQIPNSLLGDGAHWVCSGTVLVLPLRIVYLFIIREKCYSSNTMPLAPYVYNIASNSWGSFSPILQWIWRIISTKYMRSQCHGVIPGVRIFLREWYFLCSLCPYIVLLMRLPGPLLRHIEDDWYWCNAWIHALTKYHLRIQPKKYLGTLATRYY